MLPHANRSAPHNSSHTYQQNEIDYDYKPSKVSKMQIKGEVQAIQDRGIQKSSAEFYGVTSYLGNHYYPYTDESGAVVAAKVRNVENKDFHVEGQWGKATLFGQQKFNKNGMYVTIVEGELDALAAFQMCGSKYPCVSIRNGASSALKDCKANYDWLNSFENIVVCFDNDDPGQKAAQEVAELFGNKVKIFKASDNYKDACDYLKEGSVQKFVKDWWAAEQWQPDGIISAANVLEAIQKPLEKAPVSYPWEGINKMLYGLRTSELVVLAAGSGLGKSTILREIVSHILNNTSEKVGLAFLEETPERTMRGLVGLEMNKKIHLPDAVYNPKEVEEVYANLDLNNRVFLLRL